MSRHNPTTIQTLQLCEYGCNTVAKFKFKSGKLCCCDAVQKCQGHIAKGINTKKADVDPESGLNALQRGQYNAHLSKLKNDGYVRAGRSISDTKNKLVNGVKQCTESNNKMKRTKLTVGPDGLTNAQRSARKAAQTRVQDIDDTGLNQYERWTAERIKNGAFDRGFEKAKQILHDVDTGLRYQGSYELKFIQECKSLYGVNWVKENLKRGPSIQYNDYYGNRRWYMSDFIINNIIYEIKSEWTWNRRGMDKILEQNNINKLTAAKQLGYKVKLIREGKEIDF